MNRRTAHTTTKTPARTGGEDRPEPACAGNPAPYDVLVDQTAGPAFHAALRVARDICGGCPLRATCLPQHADEQWARSIMGRKLTPEQRIASERSGKSANAAHAPATQSARAQGAWARRNAARLETLRELIDQGAEFPEILARLKVTRAALWKWCDNHGHKAEWFAISPQQPECVATLRTRGKKRRETDLQVAS